MLGDHVNGVMVKIFLIVDAEIIVSLEIRVVWLEMVSKYKEPAVCYNQGFVMQQV